MPVCGVGCIAIGMHDQTTSLLCRLAKHYGLTDHQIKTATNITDLMSLLKEHNPDLCVMDLNLGGHGSNTMHPLYEVFHEFERSSMKIMAASGNRKLVEQAECTPAGRRAEIYLKPVPSKFLDNFRSRVEEIVSRDKAYQVLTQPAEQSAGFYLPQQISIPLPEYRL
jgi:CheY-like chemotaxis protein